jgi:hypothetical protein
MGKLKNKEGVPKEILEEVDINKKNEPIREFDVSVIVEPHQAKIPIPKNLRLHLKLEKGAKCHLSYNEKNKEIICKFE